MLRATCATLPLALFSATIASAQANSPDSCAALAKLKLPTISSISAERIADGHFQPLGKPLIENLPPFCRVSIISNPETHSNIGIEIWLPESAWNGRLLGTGNAGGAGSINYDPLASGLRRHFATANTDLGTSPSANVMQYPLVAAADFGHRATHQMTLAAKSVIAAYYSRPPQRSYFVGCSTGGEQALSEAQRYPTDYNGIIAGAPANNRTHLHAEFLWHYQSAHIAPDNASYLQPDLVHFVTAQALKACVGKPADGGAPTDNFLTDPRACHFDPSTLPRCTVGPASNCITPAQLATLQTIYSGPTNPTTGEQIYPHIPFGSEDAGGGLIPQEDPTQFPNQHFYPFRWTFGRDWNPLTFSFDTGQTKVDDTLASMLNANNADLKPFRKQGGKLLMYTGTADPIVPFPDAVHYYERVIHANNDDLALTQSFFRYYLLPGVTHCGSGPGLNHFGAPVSSTDGDLLTSLEAWVEQNTVPAELPASNPSTHITRNLCPYPNLPTYTHGDPALATSFTCKPHPRDIPRPPADRYLH